MATSSVAQVLASILAHQIRARKDTRQPYDSEVASHAASPAPLYSQLKSRNIKNI